MRYSDIGETDLAKEMASLEYYCSYRSAKLEHFWRGYSRSGLSAVSEKD